jgi:hypothetical protein
MVAKHEKRSYVTERQKQQIGRTTRRLRQLNRVVLDELRQIARYNQTTKRYREVGVLLETAASQITYLLRFREGIVSSARDEPRVIVVSVSVVGRSQNAFPEDLMYATHEQVPPVDPAHDLELEKLLGLIFRIGERLCSRNIRSQPFPTAFVVGLRRLTAALLKQQRHLRATTPVRSAVRTEIRDYTGVHQKYHTDLHPGESPQAGQPVEGRFKQDETGGRDEE